MDPRERFEDPQEMMRVALTAWQRKMWTAMPGIVHDFDHTDGTVSVQVALNAKILNKEGVLKDTAISKLVKCPVMHLTGGGFSITVPIAAGDEVIVMFASRAIDSWWQSGGVQNVIDFRMHDLSDGFAIPGVRSVPRALSDWSTNTLQIRSDDGATSWELTNDGTINVKAPMAIHCDTPLLTNTGEIIRGYGGADQVTLGQHTHDQGPDGHGDSEEPTTPPNPGT